MATRLCSACGLEKTIRGVWYLTPERAGLTPFVCESCYRAPVAMERPQHS